MIILFLLTFLFFFIINFVNCDIIFAPIKGLMFGALYHDELFDEDETEHTIQVLLFFFSVNFIWSTFKQ